MKVQPSSAHNEDFFRSLPSDRFTRCEGALREALVDVLREQHPHPFPLTEWIKRRIGEEIKLLTSTGGSHDIQLRDKRPPRNRSRSSPRKRSTFFGRPWTESKTFSSSAVDAFFGSLPEDCFSAREEALRDAVLDFIWKSGEHATLGEMKRDAKIQQCVDAFLPKLCDLKDWIDNRVGTDVDLVRNDTTKEFMYEANHDFKQLPFEILGEMSHPRVCKYSLSSQCSHCSQCRQCSQHWQCSQR